LKPLAIAAAMIALSSPAFASTDYELGRLAFAETVQRACSLNAEQSKQVDLAIEDSEQALELGRRSARPLQLALDDWRDHHRQSAKLLRDAERDNGIARKIVCDSAFASSDYAEPQLITTTPFGFAEDGYPKPRGASCADGFTAEPTNPDHWCNPR
jgi:hypothetical protein